MLPHPSRWWWENGYIGGVESVSVEDTSMQLHRLISEPQCDISCPSHVSEVVGKMPKFSIFSGDFYSEGRGFISALGFWGKACDVESHRGIIAGGNNMVFTQSHG